ncbi:MAG: UrcA family protein [Sphingobium sp.]|nr:UrcA family protein [Sphingobium sp.]
MVRKMCLTVVALALVAGTAVITPAETRVVEKEYVGFADLDLRETSARETLRARVFAAANRVCFKDYGGLGRWECVREAIRNGKPQMASAIDRAIAGRPQIAPALALWSRPMRPRS